MLNEEFENNVEKWLDENNCYGSYNPVEEYWRVSSFNEVLNEWKYLSPKYKTREELEEYGWLYAYNSYSRKEI